MSATKTRKHVVLPSELVAEIDAFVGARGRSKFIADAAARQLRQERMRKLIDESFGLWKDEDHPELNGPEGTVGWVRQVRSESTRRLKEHLGE
jgi:hypothetical protein